MVGETVGGVRRRGGRQTPDPEVPVLTAGMEAGEVAALIAVVYGLLTLRSTSPVACGPVAAAWFERREGRRPEPSWRTRSFAVSEGRGLHRA
ncbi:hypothetical protein ACWFMI_26600 [Nocardiopsis terrae]